MQKIKAYLVGCLLGCFGAMYADAGMWIPPVIPDTLFDYLDEAGSDL
jgi:hypothetical protein